MWPPLKSSLQSIRAFREKKIINGDDDDNFWVLELNTKALCFRDKTLRYIFLESKLKRDGDRGDDE